MKTKQAKFIENAKNVNQNRYLEHFSNKILLKTQTAARHKKTVITITTSVTKN